jgi:hypothetical protein
VLQRRARVSRLLSESFAGSGGSEMAEAEVTIRLTAPEALVLGELLRRYSETGRLAIEDSAEQQALWNLECLLERVALPPPSWPTLDEARAVLRPPAES